MAKRTSSFNDLVTELMKDPEFVKEYERQRDLCMMSPEVHKEERPVHAFYKGVLGLCLECYIKTDTGGINV